jgi:tetratricopeptide (TPR) repeat protein
MMRITCMAVLWIACISSLVHASDMDSVVLGVSSQLADGATALTVGNYDEGIRLTKIGLNSSRKPIQRSAALSNLCAGFDGNEQFAKAIAHCTAALEINKRNWHAYNNRAVAHLGLGQLEAADADITRAVALNPRSKKLQRMQRAVARWLVDEQ